MEPEMKSPFTLLLNVSTKGKEQGYLSYPMKFDCSPDHAALSM
jgi:hypothetical protein